MASDTAAELIRRATRLLETVGWVQNEYGGELDAGYCSYGALDTAAERMHLWTDPELPRIMTIASNRILAAAGEKNPVPPSTLVKPVSLIKWNDDRRRTKSQVLEAFRKAAESDAG